MEHALSHEAGEAWLRSWDAQQEGYLPDREQRLSYLAELVPRPPDRTPSVLDLACGPGSVTQRLFHHHHDATVVAIDLDPVLLTIYRAVHPNVDVVEADLRDPSWTRKLPEVGPFDAVVTATALHWLPATVLPRLYAQLRELLAPGGVFLNADHAPLPSSLLSDRCREADQRELASLPGHRYDWTSWWASVGRDEHLAVLVDERDRRFADRTDEFTPPAEWQLAALTTAGFREAEVVWRRGGDAIVAAAR